MPVIKTSRIVLKAKGVKHSMVFLIILVYIVRNVFMFLKEMLTRDEFI